MLNVNTDLLHHQIPNLKQSWHPYKDATDRAKKLVDLLQKSTAKRTLIFVNSVNSAEDVQVYLHTIKCANGSPFWNLKGVVSK